MMLPAHTCSAPSREPCSLCKQRVMTQPTIVLSGRVAKTMTANWARVQPGNGAMGWPAALLIVEDHFRCRFARFKLVAYLLNLGLLLFPCCGQKLHFLPLLQYGCPQLLDPAVLFEKLVEQHRIHRFVTHSVNLPLGVAHHQVGIYLFHFLGHQPKLWNAFGVNLLLVTEGHWSQRQDCFTCFVHGLDLLLEAPRRGSGAELAVCIDKDGGAA